ncbi:MAG: GPR1/FUN34/YaaH family transporter [Nitrospirota bacterium]|nr:GPR1/FUN34/YaaH family transporter [Nitrospirota bacterium]
MTKSETAGRQMDVLAIGLFGLAVGALTVGMTPVGQIPEVNKAGMLVVALVFGGLVQILAGIAGIRYHEQLGETALTMYGFFWLTVSLVQLVSLGTTFHLDGTRFVPINLVYVFFSVVMLYLTAYRSVASSLLHDTITLTFISTVCMRLNLISEMLPGLAFLAGGTLAFYHTIGSLSQAYTEKTIVPLGPPLLQHVRVRATVPWAAVGSHGGI